MKKTRGSVRVITAGVLFTLAFAVLMTTHVLWAAEEAAAIGGVKYPSLQAAVEAAEDGDTVVLLTDVGENVTVSGKSITIDLQNNMLTGVEDASGVWYKPLKINGGKVTIQNGTIKKGSGEAVVNRGRTGTTRTTEQGSYGGNITMANAEVTLSKVTLTDNASGNVLTAKNSTLSVIGCDIVDNKGMPGSHRSLIHISGGTATFKDTVIADNGMSMDTVAALGGATVIFDGCRITGNQAECVAGILVGTGSAGDANVTLTDTTVSENRASGPTVCVGGVLVYNGKFTMAASCVADNSFERSQMSLVANDIAVRSWQAGSTIQQADTMKGSYAGYVWEEKDETIFAGPINQGSEVHSFPIKLTAVPGAEPVAEYNGTTYSKLSQAVAAALADYAVDGQDKKITMLKDSIEAVKIPDSVTFDGAMEIDLAGHTLKGKGGNDAILDIRSKGNGSFHIHDGTLENGKGCGLRFGNNGQAATNAANLSVSKVKFYNNTEYQFINTGYGDIVLTECVFTRADASYPQRYAVQSLNATNLVLDRCQIKDSVGALDVGGGYGELTKLKVTNCEIKDNVRTKENIDSTIKIGGKVDAVFTDTLISGNRQLGIVDMYSSMTADHIIELDNTSSLLLDGCRILNNEAGYKSPGGAQSSTIVSTGRLHIKDSRIEGNKAHMAGAVMQTRVHTNDTNTLVIENSVITDNTAEGKTTRSDEGHNHNYGFGVSGGVCVQATSQGLLLKGDCAIYDNTVEVIHPEEYKANDMYVYKGAKIAYEDEATFLSADCMKDGSTDFSQRIWKDGAIASSEQDPEIQSGENRYYTVINKTDTTNVARIGDTEYRTLKEAFAVARDGDTIVLISDSGNVDTEPITCDKNITLDLAGRNVILAKTSAGDKAPIVLTADAKLELKNTRDDRRKQGGIRDGGVRIGPNATLDAVDELSELNADNQGTLTLAALPAKGKIALAEGKTIKLKEGAPTTAADVTIVLEDEVLARYNAAKPTDDPAIADLVLIENADQAMLGYVTVQDHTNGAVVRKIKNGNMVLSLAKGIYLSGDGSNANSGQSADDPVRTFARAKELLEEQDLDAIYITGTVPIATAEVWDLGGKEVLRYTAFDGNLIQVKRGGELTVRNTAIDGQKQIRQGAAKSLIRVEEQGKLTIEEGAELRNNDIAYAQNGEAGVRGGAIDSAGDITMTGGSIHDCTAGLGGGVYHAKGTFDMSGGKIYNNSTRKIYMAPFNQTSFYDENFNGGGVLLAYGGEMILSEEAEISHNEAANNGGGISLGTLLSNYTNPGLAGGKTTTLTMRGGRVNDNTAGVGGGIYVQCYAVANIEGSDEHHAYIDGNYAWNNGAFPRGGGIYVNGIHESNNYTSGVLNLSRAEIFGNESAETGGAIMTCSTSETFIRDLNNVVIDGNKSNTNPGDSRILGVQADVSLTPANMGTSGGVIGQKPRDDSYISETMLGGGSFLWTTPDDREMTAQDLHNIQALLYVATGKGVNGEDLDKGTALARVHITNNKTDGGGGGIGNNGLVYSGAYREKIDVSVQKQWQDAGHQDLRPTSIKLVLKQDGVDYKTAVIRADASGDWPAYTFQDLPKYPLNEAGTAEDKTKPYVYTVTEDTSQTLANGEPLSNYYTVSGGEQATGQEQRQVETDDPGAADIEGSTKDAVTGKWKYTIAVDKYTLVNTYSDPTPCYHDPPVEKIITGNPATEPPFTFILTPKDDAFPMPDGKTGGSKTMTINGAGSMEFGRIYFDRPGTYDYTVTEEIPAADDARYEGFTFDTATWTIRYVVTNHNGNLHVTRTFYKDGKEVPGIGAATFTNDYRKDGTPPAEPPLKPGLVTKTDDPVRIGLAATLLATALMLLVGRRKAER